MTYKHIRLSNVPQSSATPTSVILITLFRPGRYNAFTELMAEELEDVFDSLSADERVRCIVVTGHGNMFCAGADLESELKASKASVRAHRDGGGRVALAIHRCRKPVIAAINGSAVGVGITMTLPMNIRIVSSKAKIGFVFARRGLVLEAASCYFLPRLIGYSKTMHLITTGSVYPSTSSLLADLFSEIVEPEDVLTRAMEIANDVANNTSVVSTHLMKDMIWHGPNTAEEAQLLTSKLMAELYESSDKNEGVDSFLGKQQARFQGSLKLHAPSVWPWWRPIDTTVPDVDTTKAKL